MKINIFEYIVMRKMIFSSEKAPTINKIKKHDIPDLYRSLHRIRSYLEFCLQFRSYKCGRSWSITTELNRANVKRPVPPQLEIERV
jgi:hypothetical protein